MKTATLTIMTAMIASIVSAESILAPINEKGYGVISGRVQSLTMYRDYEGKGNGANSTLGGIVGYTSPQWAGFDVGLALNYAGEVYENNNSKMLANEEIAILNEGWMRYSVRPDTTVLVGRKINNGEVFRADDFRQKSRSVETLQFESTGIADTRVQLGHAIRLSNWIAAGDRWEFNDFGDVFGEAYDTDGVTWAEGAYRGIEGLDIFLFDAYAWDVANLVGTRVTWALAEDRAISGTYRHESDVGDAANAHVDVYGLALQQEVGTVRLEGGYFGVHGDDMRFQETTTGINHPLGASMIICSGQFNGGADTAYLKAVTKVGDTTLYGLYNYTWQDHDKTPYDGQELNVVVKQPLTENLSAAFKGGGGEHNGKSGEEDVSFLDTRLFITYAF